jgi:hypothetical protein
MKLMTEASLFPVIPYLHEQTYDREVMSMSDYVHTDRSRMQFENRTIESRMMFAACYALFLVGAVVRRLMPWRRQPGVGRSGNRESVFTEARSAAGTIVTSSFMGL